MSKKLPLILAALVLLGGGSAQAGFLDGLKKIGKKVETGLRKVRNTLIEDFKEALDGITIDDDGGASDGQRLNKGIKTLIGHKSCNWDQLSRALPLAALIGGTRVDSVDQFAEVPAQWQLLGIDKETDKRIEDLPCDMWPYFHELQRHEEDGIASEKQLYSLMADNGLYARVFKNEEEKRIALVIYGTETDIENKPEKVAQDIETNIDQALGEHSASHTMAASWLGFLIEKYSDYSVECVGHSKGGGECLYAAAKNNAPGMIFNAAGLRGTMRQPVEEKWDAQLPDVLGKIAHIQVKGEALQFVKAIGFGRIWDEVNSCDVMPHDEELDPWKRHEMRTVHQSVKRLWELERIKQAKKGSSRLYL